MAELLDIYDENRAYVGTKQRTQVHVDGDWHRCLHLWVAAEIGGVRSVVMQRRALDKDSLPGLLDVSVGGHLAAGESVSEGLREAEEELGMHVTPEDITVLGERPVVGIPHAGFINREFCTVALLRDDRRLQDFAPEPGELAGVVRVPLHALRTMLADPDAFVAVDEFTGEANVRSAVCRADLVDNGYLPVLAIMVDRFLDGERDLAI